MLVAEDYKSPAPVVMNGRHLLWKVKWKFYSIFLELVWKTEILSSCELVNKFLKKEKKNICFSFLRGMDWVSFKERLSEILTLLFTCFRKGRKTQVCDEWIAIAINQNFLNVVIAIYYCDNLGQKNNKFNTESYLIYLLQRIATNLLSKEQSPNKKLQLISCYELTVPVTGTNPKFIIALWTANSLHCIDIFKDRNVKF